LILLIFKISFAAPYPAQGYGQPPQGYQHQAQVHPQPAQGYPQPQYNPGVPSAPYPQDLYGGAQVLKSKFKEIGPNFFFL